MVKLHRIHTCKVIWEQEISGDNSCWGKRRPVWGSLRTIGTPIIGKRPLFRTVSTSNGEQARGSWAAHGKALVVEVSETRVFGLETTEALGKQVLYIARDGSVAKRLPHICLLVSILSATVGFQSHLLSPTVRAIIFLITLSSSEHLLSDSFAQSSGLIFIEF